MLCAWRKHLGLIQADACKTGTGTGTEPGTENATLARIPCYTRVLHTISTSRKTLARRVSCACAAILGVFAMPEQTSLAETGTASQPGAVQPNATALRQAILDLRDSFPGGYPRAEEFLKRLEALEKAPNPERWLALQRDALLANPLVSGQPLLFVVHRQYRPDHHNTETMFQTGEINTASYEGGGAIKLIDFAKGGAVTTLVDAGANGVARDPEVYFDGSRVIFSMRRGIADDYHLYEVRADGTGLRQLTSAPGVFDIDPLYLPDGNIVFTSSREPKYCMCNRHIMGNLFRMEADGANVVQIGKNTLFEGHGALLQDGRILYDRWEYVDRNFGDAQGLWTMNPDGTSHAIWFKNNTGSPGAALQGRPIPNTQRVICTFSSCHDRPWGALAIVDRRLGIEGRAPVVRTWPAEAVNLVSEHGNFDTFKRVTPKYEDPYPLSDKYFLCSRTIGKGEQLGIFLLDVFGNELLLHAEEAGCFNPMPLGRRPRPPVLPFRRDFAGNDGFFYIQDVYQGTHMAGVKPGSVKSLRVVEQGEKRSFTNPHWVGQGAQAPAMNWDDFSNKRILGTARVEADGSAYFAVPSGRFVFFQLLDKDGMMIQSMRSATTIQSGETQSCVGCHEDRLTGPALGNRRTSLALNRKPDPLNGWHGAPRFFNYRAEVQPVFDKACVRCHDIGKKAGEKLVLAGDRGLVFNASYFDLWSKRFISVIGAGPAPIQSAYSWGSHASRLVRTLLSGTGPYDVKLSLEDQDRIVTWIDLNAPYYPTYASAHPENQYGRSPLDNRQIARLLELGVLGVGPAPTQRMEQKAAEQVSFDRPELSPGLAKLKDKSDPKYLEALAIIRSGAESLARNPEADMPGFKPCAVDATRELKYALRQQIELKNREAISAGKKRYDAPGEAQPTVEP